MNRFIHENMSFRNTIDHFRIFIQGAIECHCQKLVYVVTLIGECFAAIRYKRVSSIQMYRKRTKRAQNSLEGGWKRIWARMKEDSKRSDRGKWSVVGLHVTAYCMQVDRSHQGYRAQFKTNNITCLYASRSIHIHIYCDMQAEKHGEHSESEKQRVRIWERKFNVK